MKTLILVGGGHAHLYLIKKMISEKLEDFKTILISSGKKQYYSGMVSAYLESLYREKDFSVDLSNLCEKSEVLFTEDEVVRINPKNKTIETKKGMTYDYDLLSLDMGSDIVGKNIPGAQEFSTMVKPLQQLAD